MDNWIIKQKIDFARPVSQQGSPDVLMLPGDNLAHTWQVACLKNDIPVDLSGASVTAYFLRVDGNAVMVTGEATGNVASVTLTQECYAFAGGLRGVMRITDPETEAVVSMAEHAFVVRPAVDAGGIIDPGEVIPSIDELIAMIDEMEEAAAAAEAAATKSVRYDSAQTLTDAQKEQARGNIDAASEDDIADLKSELDDIVVRTVSPNLYDITACNPADLHTYNSSGVYVESDYYATSGKIPVEAETQYTFSANGAVKNVRYFKGDSGETFISGENTTGTFTTPALCTFVAVQLFAAAHTTEQYNAAIAVAQLELGSEATPYQPYGTESHILLESIDKGDELGNFVDVIESANADDVGKALSPKTITDGVVTEWEFKALDSSSIIDEITDTKQSKNLYNPAACNPADKYTYNSSGAYTASDVFATSGKIPVDPETQYIFSAGGARVKNVRYFKGETGETFISGENVDDGPFTTPALCTFVAVQLFSAAHTTEQYEAAIAVAQLEKGATATPYEPYGETHYVPLSAVEDGDKLGGIGDAFITQSQINLYDKTFAVNGKYYYSDGSIQTSADWAITGYIPVEPNTQYNLSRDINAPMSLGGTVKMYDQDKTYIGNATLGNYVYDTLYAFVTGPTTHYIGVGLTLAGHTEQDFTDTIDTLMLCYGTMRPHNYAAYNSESVVPANKLGDAFFRRDNFAGKRWLATGTSITWYDGKAYQVGLHAGELCRGYVGVVTSRKKLLATNEGISGSTLGNVSDSSLINRYTSLDWAHADIATLEYGVNDLGHNIPVGTAADAAGTNTFAACLKTIIEYALAQNPKIILIICTDPDVRGANINSNGDTLKDFSDVTIAVAAQYRLPVCDWYYHSGINALNKGDQSKDWMTVDGTHPSDVGHQRMGAMLIQTLESVID